MLCQDSMETVDHLFSECTFSTIIWRSTCSPIGMHQLHVTFKGLCLDWRRRNITKFAQPVVLKLFEAIT